MLTMDSLVLWILLCATNKKSNQKNTRKIEALCLRDFPNGKAFTFFNKYKTCMHIENVRGQKSIWITAWLMTASIQSQ